MQTINSILEFLSGTGLHITQAIVVLLIGLFVIKKIALVAKFALVKATSNKTMASFVTNVLNVVLTFVLIIIIFNILSISTSGLMELLSACVLAVGLSLKDSVSHLASGLIIVSTKPFKEGDFVKINGVEGTIMAVHMFNTQLKTVDNKIITVPNSSVVGNNITNYDNLAIRRVDIKVSVSYDTDINKCMDVLKETAQKRKNVLKTPETEIVLDEYASSGLVFVVKVWTRSGNYWDVRNGLMLEFFNALKENNIEIPFDQLDVNIKTSEEEAVKENKNVNVEENK